MLSDDLCSNYFVFLAGIVSLVISV